MICVKKPKITTNETRRKAHFIKKNFARVQKKHTAQWNKKSFNCIKIFYSLLTIFTSKEHKKILVYRRSEVRRWDEENFIFSLIYKSLTTHDLQAVKKPLKRKVNRLQERLLTKLIFSKFFASRKIYFFFKFKFCAFIKYVYRIEKSSGNQSRRWFRKDQKFKSAVDGRKWFR